jgi:phosphatidylglycerophosphate synthase
MDKPNDIKRAVEIEKFTNRALIHPISGRLVPLFHRLDVHPNTVSIAGAVSGALAALCYYGYEHLALTIAGFVLMITWHVMDGADGQLARLSGKVTASGYVIDGICDYTTFILVYIALALRLAEKFGGDIWILVVAAGLSHIVQAAAFELQRAAYNKWARGKAFAPAAAAAAQRATQGQASPFALFRVFAASYAAVQRPFHPIDEDTAQRLQAYGAQSAETAAAVGAAYADAFRTAVLRWSWQSANNRTIAIFLACLLGRPILYFLVEVTLLNLGLVLLIGMNHQRAARIRAWLASQGA